MLPRIGSMPKPIVATGKLQESLNPRLLLTKMRIGESGKGSFFVGETETIIKSCFDEEGCEDVEPV